MSGKQTEALQIAQRLDWWVNNTILTCERTAAEAAAELRRLDEVNKELLEALRVTAQSLAWNHAGKCRGFHRGLAQPDDALAIARTAITKAETTK